jgi:hypothetical protein
MRRHKSTFWDTPGGWIPLEGGSFLDYNPGYDNRGLVKPPPRRFLQIGQDPYNPAPAPQLLPVLKPPKIYEQTGTQAYPYRIPTISYDAALQQATAKQNIPSNYAWDAQVTKRGENFINIEPTAAPVDIEQTYEAPIGPETEPPPTRTEELLEQLLHETQRRPVSLPESEVGVTYARPYKPKVIRTELLAPETEEGPPPPPPSPRPRIEGPRVFAPSASELQERLAGLKRTAEGQPQVVQGRDRPMGAPVPPEEFAARRAEQRRTTAREAKERLDQLKANLAEQLGQPSE